MLLIIQLFFNAVDHQLFKLIFPLATICFQWVHQLYITLEVLNCPWTASEDDVLYRMERDDGGVLIA